MKKESVIAIVIAAIVLAAAAGGAMLFAVKQTTNVEYSLSYNLDGGINAEENPVKYKYGVGTELYDAHKTGYIFTGWYTDSGLTSKVDRISSSMSGNYNLTAGWEKSMVGNELTFDVTGTITQTSFMVPTTTTITGTMTSGYYAYSESRGYMIEQTVDATKKTGSSTEPVKSEETYWSKETGDDYTWENIGTSSVKTVYGEKTCIVYKGTDDTSTQTQYVGKDDGILYYAKYYSKTSVPPFSSSTTEIEYTLKTLKTIEPKTENITVASYNGIGISTTGSGVYTAGSNITLVATSGDKEFKGWYDEENNLLSKSKTYRIDNALVDYKVYAMNTSNPDMVSDSKTVSISPAVSLSDVVWTFTDGEEEKVIKADTLNYTFTESGEHRIDYSGTDSNSKTYYGTIQTINGAVKKTFNWTFEKTSYTYDLYITYNDYMEYVNDPTSRTQGSESHDLQFVTYEDQYVKKLATDLNDIASKESMSEVKKANFMLSFVQNIEYVSDIDSKGVEEYWKYPVETLYEQNGDCEDTAILYCAMMKALGYKDALLIFSGHMAAGLYVDGASGTYFEKDGVKYYYCETTATGWTVGMIPSGYDNARVIPVV